MNLLNGVNSLNVLKREEAETFRSLGLSERPNTTGKLTPLKSQKDIETTKKELRKAADGFEAIFTRQLLKTMRSTLTEKSMFGEGPSGDIYGDILDSAIADKMAARGDIGLADMLYGNMVRKLELELNGDNKDNSEVKNNSGMVNTPFQFVTKE